MVEGVAIATVGGAMAVGVKAPVFVVSVLYFIDAPSDVVVDALIEALPGVWTGMIIGVIVLAIGVGVGVNIFVVAMTALRCSTLAPVEAFSCLVLGSR